MNRKKLTPETFEECVKLVEEMKRKKTNCSLAKHNVFLLYLYSSVTVLVTVVEILIKCS